MKLVLAIALIGVIIVAVLMILRPAGPRITTIEHRRDEVDDTKDGDDA